MGAEAQRAVASAALRDAARAELGRRRGVALEALLKPDDARLRERLLERVGREAGGQFAATMRRLEGRAWPDAEMLAEVWRWALWLFSVRGLPLDTTVTRYVERVHTLAEFLGERGGDWRAVSLEALEHWLKALWMDKRHGANQRQVAVAAARSFYDWRAGAVPGAPRCAEGLRSPKVVKRVPRRYSRAELRRLFGAIAHERTPMLRLRDQAMLLFLYATGGRASEVAELRADQVRIEGRVAVVRFLGKGAKEREVAFEGPAVQAFLQWLDARSHDERIRCETVFCNLTVRAGHPSHGYGDGLTRKGVYDVIRRLAKLGGVNGSGVHRLRVTFATQLYDDGCDLERIRVAMGHETIETTRRYLSLSDRQRSVRLKPHRQHQVLGTVPDGMPLWAKHQEGTGRV